MKRILLVEDNPADVELFIEVLDIENVRCDLAVAHDGATALDRLRSGPFPSLILLDVNLPRLSGLELLAVIKKDDVLKRIPAVMMSSSEAPNDINTAYDLQASAYVRKPSDLQGLRNLVRALNAFWLSLVCDPR